MVNPIPASVRRLWDEWNIRGVLLFSFSLQFLLMLLAPTRKYSAHKLLLMLVWSAYLLADWAAPFAGGLIVDHQGRAAESSASVENRDLLAFWSPFLLLHLGGPDSITAFALEDNELWLRHLLGLAFQAIAALYVFALSLPKNKLWIPTVLIFVAGVIKYVERMRALFQASMDGLQNSMQDSDEQWYKVNYNKFVLEEISPEKKAMSTQEPEESKTEPEKDSVNLYYVKVVKSAYGYFKTFRGLLVGLMFDFGKCGQFTCFFQGLTPETSLRIIEVELNFIYDVLYTKVLIVRYIFRALTLGSVTAALVIFHFQIKEPGFNKFDVGITYTLLLGAIALDVVSVIMLIFSDWTLAKLELPHEGESARSQRTHEGISAGPSMTIEEETTRPSRKDSWSTKHLKCLLAFTYNSFLYYKDSWWYHSPCLERPVVQHEVTAAPLFFSWWSGSIHTLNLISYCLKDRPTSIYEFRGWMDFIIRKITRWSPINGITKIIHQLHAIISKGIVRPSCILLSITKPILDFLKRSSSGVSKCMAKDTRTARFFRKFPVNLIDILGVQSFLQGIKDMRCISNERFTKELWRFIFKELKRKAGRAYNPLTANEISSLRANGVRLSNVRWRSRVMKFVEEEGSKLSWRLTDFGYDESLLLWHIATELCYNTDGGVPDDNHDEHGFSSYDYRVFSKLLSDYMMYLFVMQPNLLPIVAGAGKIRFQDACEHVEYFFRKMQSVPKDQKEACKMILQSDGTEAIGDSSVVTEMISKCSVVSYALALAGVLNSYTDNWELLGSAWVELLSYAASHCKASVHAQQLSKGGDLITLVWLLMAQLGIGEFYI